MEKNSYETECVIAGLQRLIEIANDKHPYHTDGEDATLPDPFPYVLECSVGSMGMPLDSYDDEEMIKVGLCKIKKLIEGEINEKK